MKMNEGTGLKGFSPVSGDPGTRGEMRTGENLFSISCADFENQ
jgi:hypothetical protein